MSFMTKLILLRKTSELLKVLKLPIFTYALNLIFDT